MPGDVSGGAVHVQAGKYVSDKTMVRAMRDKRRIAELLESLVAVSQTTEEMLPMDELAAQSLSNPGNRRKAMMARIKGIEQHAKTKGHVALFLTITCPSRMHARHSKSGAPNERYDGTSPRQAQTHLSGVWRDALRKLAHQGVRPFGLRVTEPHHDGCPHRHVLAFVAPEHSEILIDVIRTYLRRMGLVVRQKPNGRPLVNRAHYDTTMNGLAMIEQRRRRAPAWSVAA